MHNLCPIQVLVSSTTMSDGMFEMLGWCSITEEIVADDDVLHHECCIISHQVSSTAVSSPPGVSWDWVMRQPRRAIFGCGASSDRYG
jgi:hypothetical protein